MESAASSFLPNPKAHFPGFHIPNSSASVRPPSAAPIPRRKSCRYRLRQNVHNDNLKSCRATSASTPDSHQPTTVSRVHETGSTLLGCVQKPLALAFFCLAVGSAPFFLPSPAHAIVSVTTRDERKVRKGSESRTADEHQFSIYTHTLLQTVSILLGRIDEAKSGQVDKDVVKEALKKVKEKRREIQEDVLVSLHSEQRVLWNEKADLIKRSEQVLDAWRTADKERSSLLKKRRRSDRTQARLELLQKTMDHAEEEYNQLQEKVDAIDDNILEKETMTYSITIWELSCVERECELLVERFKGWPKQEAVKSQEQTLPRLSKDVIEKELEKARKECFEQKILPTVVEVKDSELFADETTRSFVQNVKRALKNSSDLQRDLEAQMKQNLNRYGGERHFFGRTPEEEAVKGYPAAELKWVFGQKEVVVPNAAQLQLLHGWKKWREDAKAKLKKELVENPDRGRKYISKREESILIDRDRLMSKTWYNEERKRWEMDPVAVPFAVSRKLVEHARIRHDWAAMYLSLKGDDKEYFIDTRDFDLQFKDFGGFDGLYTKLLASGTPTSVHFMWIPFSDMNFLEQMMLTLKLILHLSYQMTQMMVGVWESGFVSYVRRRISSPIKNINDDIMMTIGFNLFEFVVPYQVRMALGTTWPEGADASAEDSWYIRWQAEAEVNFRSRKRRTIKWQLWFLIRSAVYAYILFQVFCFMRRIGRTVLSPLSFDLYAMNPHLRKLKRSFLLHLRGWDIYYKITRESWILKKAEEDTDSLQKILDQPDAVRTVFDQMKRIRNPPIRLDDFATVESMREEIREIVSFLQNPAAFQKMGARAPKGVLIVGEHKTGKTSLALAIAAEAKVPVVELKAPQLEDWRLAGLGAANIRELFQTARDLAPLILFVEDFDQFAGVRGQFLHTIRQDHEGFINQLLVELDGFEKQDGVVLLATTTNLKEIDPALQRPGRMDRILHLQRPTQLEREKILNLAAKETMDEDLIEFVDWEKVAEKTAFLSTTQLRLVPLALEGSAFRSKFLDTDELMSYCGWLATLSIYIPNWLRRTPPVKKISRWFINHLGLTLTREDLQSVVDLMEPYGQISNGIELYSPPLDWTRKTKLPHAVWAAGIGLIALLFPNFDMVDNIWLEPSSWAGIGCIKITKAKTEASFIENVETRSYLEKQLVCCFGPYVASEMLLPFGEESILSSSQLNRAQEIATRMVIQYGWGPDDNPTVYFHNNAVSTLSMGNNYELEMAAKVEKIYNLAYDRARHMLLRNRRVLERVVEELLEFESLTGKDLLKILDDYGGIQEKEPFFLTESHMQPIASRFLGNGNGIGLSLVPAS